jgi:hypothetical protein
MVELLWFSKIEIKTASFTSIFIRQRIFRQFRRQQIQQKSGRSSGSRRGDKERRILL